MYPMHIICTHEVHVNVHYMYMYMYIHVRTYIYYTDVPKHFESSIAYDSNIENKDCYRPKNMLMTNLWCVCVCVCVCARIRKHTCIICMYMYIHVCVHVCVYTYTCIHCTRITYNVVDEWVGCYGSWHHTENDHPELVIDIVLVNIE